MVENDLQHLHVLGALLSIFGLACVFLAVDMLLGHRRAARLSAGSGYGGHMNAGVEPDMGARPVEGQARIGSADDAGDAEKRDDRKAREEFWRREEADFVAHAKSLSDFDGEPFAYTFVPFAGGMAIAALFESRVFILQCGSRRHEVHFSQVRSFKFVPAGRGRHDLHVMISSLDTPRLVVGQLDTGAMDRWNEIYLRVKEGRI